MNKEHIIQREIIQILRLHSVFCYAIPNGGKREVKTIFQRRTGRVISFCPEGKKLKDEGVMPGVADIHILIPGKIIFVEVKTDKGVLSPNQKEFKKNIENLGFEYYIWRDIQDAESFIRKYKK